MNSYSVFLLTVLVATVAAQQERRAIAVVSGPTGVTGNITFTQTQNGVTITGVVTGLTKGQHGFHVHEKGDLSNGCTSTGGHFNPDKHPHGAPEDTRRHAGDLGNIEANELGVATINKTDGRISLSNARNNVIGRGVVIHADADDLGRGGQSDSLATGHAGSRVACGVIGTLSSSGRGNVAAASVLLTLLTTSLTLSLVNSY